MQLSGTDTSETEQLDGQVSERAVASASPEGVPEQRASRWWLAGAFVLALAAFVPDAFGRQVFDTKIDLTVNPYNFAREILYLWAPNGWFGYLRNQFQGSAFPTDPFFILGHLLTIPPWLVQRAWMAIVVTVAFWGIVRLAEEFRIGSLRSRLVAGAAFALLPTLTMLVGSVTAEAAPGVLTVWATIPLIRASRGGSPMRGAALSGVAVLFMGGTNAADTLYALVIPALFLLTRESSPRKRSLIGWWVVFVALATAWWAIPLLFLAKYGFNFLPYVEQSVTTTGTSSATSALSGSSVWTAYLDVAGLGWNQAAITITRDLVVIVGAALMAATGLYGIASREIRERRFLVVSLAVTAVIALAAYWGPVGGPFSRFLLPILNGSLAPVRSVYKIEPEIGLLLALGIAHSLYKVSHWKPGRIGPVAWRVGVGVLVIAVLASLATPYILGRATNNYSFASIPSYWYKVADYLDQNSPRNTALVLPASSHGEYVWGWTVDQPLEALARSPWANDQAVPFGGAGSSRMVDSIELALRTGTASPGLTALLWRSGIKYVVVQNDALWQLSDSPSPLQVHQVLEASGLKRVAQFGPGIETSVIDSPTAVTRQDVLQGPVPGGRNLRGATTRRREASTTVASDNARGLVGSIGEWRTRSNQTTTRPRPPRREPSSHSGWGLAWWSVPRTYFRRHGHIASRNTNFGLVNDNSSYPLTATAQLSNLSGLPDATAVPSQLLPFPGVQHQTVAVLKGASNITASSTGSAFFYLPEYNPENVFDGLSPTGWIAGNPNGSVGEWIQINFDHPLNPRGTHISSTSGPRTRTLRGSASPPTRDRSSITCARPAARNS